MRSSIFYLLSLIVVSFAPFCNQSSHAQTDYEEWLSGAMATRLGQHREWRVVIGGGAGLAPEYRGADNYETKQLPLLDIEWRGTYFASTQRGFGVNVVRQQSTKVGPRITIDQGRDTADSSALEGLSDVERTIEAGLFFQHYTDAWRIEGDIRRGLNGHKGMIGSLDVGLGGALADNANLIIGANIFAADKTYFKKYFAVPEGGSRNFSFFQPESGMRNWGVYATLVYLISDQVFLTLDGRASLLIGDAANSPISISDDQYFSAVSLAYRF